jgi:hypothetical protein
LKLFLIFFCRKSIMWFTTVQVKSFCGRETGERENLGSIYNDYYNGQ